MATRLRSNSPNRGPSRCGCSNSISTPGAGLGCGGDRFAAHSGLSMAAVHGPKVGRGAAKCQRLSGTMDGSRRAMHAGHTDLQRRFGRLPQQTPRRDRLRASGGEQEGVGADVPQDRVAAAFAAQRNQDGAGVQRRERTQHAAGMTHRHAASGAAPQHLGDRHVEMVGAVGVDIVIDDPPDDDEVRAQRGAKVERLVHRAGLGRGGSESRHES